MFADLSLHYVIDERITEYTLIFTDKRILIIVWSLIEEFYLGKNIHYSSLDLEIVFTVDSA